MRSLYHASHKECEGHPTSRPWDLEDFCRSGDTRRMCCCLSLTLLCPQDLLIWVGLSPSDLEIPGLEGLPSLFGSASLPLAVCCPTEG